MLEVRIISAKSTLITRTQDHCFSPLRNGKSRRPTYQHGLREVLVDYLIVRIIVLALTDRSKINLNTV